MRVPHYCMCFLAGLGLAWGAANPSFGQPTLERLEKSIRERTDAAAQPVAGAKPPAEAGRPAGYLGLTADDANDRGRGVRVLAVRAGGPAAAAGLKADDLITAIGGVRVREMSDMAEIMALFPAGDTVAMDVQRDGKQQQVKVTLGQPPGAKEAPKQVAKEPVKEAAKPLLPAVKADAAAKIPAEDTDVVPELTPRIKPLLPAAPPPTVEQLQRRIEQLERRVEQLEKALADARKKPM